MIQSTTEAKLGVFEHNTLSQIGTMYDQIIFVLNTPSSLTLMDSQDMKNNPIKIYITD